MGSRPRGGSSIRTSLGRKNSHSTTRNQVPRVKVEKFIKMSGGGALQLIHSETSRPRINSSSEISSLQTLRRTNLTPCPASSVACPPFPKITETISAHSASTPEKFWIAICDLSKRTRKLFGD